jgi:hypothetical protein
VSTSMYRPFCVDVLVATNGVDTFGSLSRAVDLNVDAFWSLKLTAGENIDSFRSAIVASHDDVDSFWSVSYP